MNWKDISAKISKAAPILGTLIGGPAGGAVGTLISTVLGVPDTPDAVEQALSINPDAAVKLREIEATQAVELQKLLVTAEANRLQLETASVQAINETMRVEAVSEKWPTYSWRPFIGFTFGSYILALWVLPLFGLKPVELDNEIVLAVGGILGIASFYRGRQKHEETKNKSF